MARAKETTKRREGKTPRLLSEPASIMGPRLIFILSVVGLCILGLVMVYSASSITAYNESGNPADYFIRQAVFLLIGIILSAVCSRIPYTLWATPAVFISLWGITVVLLAFTAFGLGITALGAERSISIAGFSLQPAEFAKITIVMTAASITQMFLEEKIDLRRFVVIVLVATVLPLILIYRQPDLGTAIILAVGIIALALLAGIPWKVVFAILGIMVLYVVFACVTQPYHLDRIITMFDPWVDPQGDGYQSIQSLYAFGSGGIFGTGLGLSRQKYLYLPYAHTDFIFAIIGEELGLIGAVLVVALFGLFIFAGMRICRTAPDTFGCMLAGSFTVMIGFQACVNMACVTGIAPVTGKALPLISYGGSSMIATMIMIGVILSVSFRSKVGMSYERKRDNFMVIDGGARKGQAQRDRQAQHAGDEPAGNVISLQGSARERRRGSRADGAAHQEGRRSKGAQAKDAKSRGERSREARGSRSHGTRGSHGKRSSSRDTRSSAQVHSPSRSGAGDAASKKSSGGYADLKRKGNPHRHV